MFDCNDFNGLNYNILSSSLSFIFLMKYFQGLPVNAEMWKIGANMSQIVISKKSRQNVQNIVGFVKVISQIFK